MQAFDSFVNSNAANVTLDVTDTIETDFLTSLGVPVHDDTKPLEAPWEYVDVGGVAAVKHNGVYVAWLDYENGVAYKLHCL